MATVGHTLGAAPTSLSMVFVLARPSSPEALIWHQCDQVNRVAEALAGHNDQDSCVEVWYCAQAVYVVHVLHAFNPAWPWPWSVMLLWPEWLALTAVEHREGSLDLTSSRRVFQQRGIYGGRWQMNVTHNATTDEDILHGAL